MTCEKKEIETTSVNSSHCGSASRVTRHASRSSLQFKGNWLVNYDPGEQKYPEILIVLAQIQDYLAHNGINFSTINVVFNNKSEINYFFKAFDIIFMIFSGIDCIFQETKTEPGTKPVFPPLDRPIKTVSLLFPKNESDPRWKTIGLPAGQLFLSSSLRAAGYEPIPRPMALSGEKWPPEALSADLTGITLFEDLLPLLGPLLADFRGSYRGILAAGGPFPTLAPLAAVYQLPQINLVVRGEAELALPKILQALNQGDAAAFFAHKGVFWQQPGVLAMAGLDQVNRPTDLGSLAIDLGFLGAGQVEPGLEMNFSRGCRRGCVFCCRAQGGRFRKLPLEKADELLSAYARQARELGAEGRAVFTVNVNDDDILQDAEYAREIFALIKRHGLRIFGVQTSTASLVKANGEADLKIADSVADRELYADDDPLLWLGTDAFLPARARRLGKKLPPRENFRGLLGELEKRRVRHYHYWISSDGESTWPEFVEELALLYSFFRDFPHFGLLAHAPFIVPYPASALFGRLPADDPRLKLKLSLDAPDARFRYRVIDRWETNWPQLNNLLKNEKAGGEKGFFDFLKEKDFAASAQLAYHFLKQELLQAGVDNRDELSLAVERLSGVIERFIDS